MPKDATKNVDRYKIRGGQINEFDFHRNQEEFAEQNEKSSLATKAQKAQKRQAAVPKQAAVPQKA